MALRQNLIRFKKRRKLPLSRAYVYLCIKLRLPYRGYAEGVPCIGIHKAGVRVNPFVVNFGAAPYGSSSSLQLISGAVLHAVSIGHYV